MCSSDKNGPFILRFSRSMHRDNPRFFFGGKPRTAPGSRPDPHQFADNLRNGHDLYAGYDYNKGLPTYANITLKPGSLSKSLRYHFLKNTGMRPIASRSADRLIFAIDDAAELSRLTGIMSHSRNSAFLASFSHVSDIACILPAEKELCRRPASPDISLQLFPYKDGYEPLLHFLKDGMNLPDAEIIRCGTAAYAKLRLQSTTDPQVLSTHSLIRSMACGHEIILQEQYVRHEDLKLDCIVKRDFSASYPKAAVIDSGLADSSFLKEWELATESYIDPSERQPRHGTFVCGRMLGRDEQFGGITFLNVEVIPKSGNLNLSDFEKYMDDVLRKYHKTVKIYNISLGTSEALQDEYTIAAHLLDNLQKKYDVLFVISAGNTDISTPGRISSPAESIHSLTVGSVSHTDTNYQPKHSPSLFTRHGPAPCSFIKPDIASYGGAHEKRYGKLRPVGVFSIGERNELAEDIGTSHAAPLVTAIAARLYHRYSHAFKSPDMVKAMIIHYTFLRNTERTTDLFTGYGVTPPTLTEETDSAVYLHSGHILPEKIVELPEIPVPSEMFSEGKAEGEIMMTLVYKTDTDINFPHYYSMCNIEASLGYYSAGKWQGILTSKNIIPYKCDEKHGKDIEEISRWQPVKVFRCAMKGRKIPAKLSLRLITSKRDFYTEKNEMGYSIVISFTRNGKNLYQSLEKSYTQYSDTLEPASEMWKTCG